DDDLAVFLDGVQQKVIMTPLPPPQYSVSRERMGFDRFIDPIALPAPAHVDRPLLRRFAGRVIRESAALMPKAFSGTRYHAPGLALREPRDAKLVQIYAQRPSARSRFKSAWLLMDRVAAADDNAEALYWHLRSSDARINAFFVLRRDSAHWDRM